MSDTLQPVQISRKPAPAQGSRDPLTADEARRAIRAAETALLDERRMLTADELAELAYVPDASVPSLAALAHEVRLAWCGPEVEVEGFISVAPPENLYDFSFLAPCPSSGLIIHGDKDRVAPPTSVQKLVDKLKTQKGITIEQQVVEGANHFFENKIDELTDRCAEYLDRRRADIAAGKGR